MASCSKVKGKTKKGDDVLCGLVAQDKSEYCPRHTFLHNIEVKEAHDQELAAIEKKQANGGGGFPQTREQLLRRGYAFHGNRDCTGCGKPIEWWKTPAARMAPFDPMPELTSHCVSHFATCVRSASFRKTG